MDKTVSRNHHYTSPDRIRKQESAPRPLPPPRPATACDARSLGGCWLIAQLAYHPWDSPFNAVAGFYRRVNSQASDVRNCSAVLVSRDSGIRAASEKTIW